MKTAIKRDILSSNLLVGLLIFLPLVISLRDIVSGSIPFWYDPARDFLLALKNQAHPTLIGQETGIPGLFYGPYWIWLLSLALFISKDPRVVVILVQTIPYFVFFPFLLYKLSDSNRLVFLLAWYLFIFSFKNYTTYLWNPHLAPLIFLFLIWQASRLDWSLASSRNLKRLLFLGFTSGLLLSFHMSFGIGVTLALFLFPFFEQLTPRKQITRILTKLKLAAGSSTLLLLGSVLAFIPFFLFELRHNLIQSSAVIDTFIKTVVYDSRVVGLGGLTKIQIFENFFRQGTKLLPLPLNMSILVYLVVALGIIYSLWKSYLKSEQKKVLLFITLSGILILFVYLSTNNPVWEYHFLGVEVIFLVMLLISMSVLKSFRILVAVLVAVLLLSTSRNFIKDLSQDPLTFPSLVSKEGIVKLIYADAAGKPFSVFAYSPSIYTYDFDYLFQTVPDKQSQLQNNPVQVLVYLIIPETSEAVKNDFIYYKTPEIEFDTVGEWTSPDMTKVVKRSRLMPASDNPI